MALKLTDVDKERIRVALINLTSVLNEVKRKPLKGKALEEMKELEAVVVGLECFLLNR